MMPNTERAETGSSWSFPGPCPACGACLRIAFDGFDVTFVCTGCGTRWCYSMGWFQRAEP
jgi:hypothetical protein